MKPFLAAILVFSAAAANAKPTLVFFAGCGGGNPLVNRFLKDAASSPMKDQFSFEGEAYAAGSVYKPRSAVVARSEKQIQKYVDRILKNPDQKFILAAHSSGSAPVYEIARRVLAAQKGSRVSNLEIINIDGFHPPDEFKGKMTVHCYSAKNGRGKESPNYFSSQPACTTYDHITYENCQTSGCLHFRLVNLSASGASGSYQNPRFNLEWIHLPQSEVSNLNSGEPAAER